MSDALGSGAARSVRGTIFLSERRQEEECVSRGTVANQCAGCCAETDGMVKCDALSDWSAASRGAFSGSGARSISTTCSALQKKQYRDMMPPLTRRLEAETLLFVLRGTQERKRSESMNSHIISLLFHK